MIKTIHLDEESFEYVKDLLKVEIEEKEKQQSAFLSVESYEEATSALAVLYKAEIAFEEAS